MFHSRNRHSFRCADARSERETEIPEEKLPTYLMIYLCCSSYICELWLSVAIFGLCVSMYQPNAQLTLSLAKVGHSPEALNHA